MWLAIVLAAVPLTKTQQAWRAQALTAGERLQSAGKDACEIALQTAFVLHATKPELVEKQNAKAEFMHLVLQAGPKEAFDLAYVYDRDKDALVGARINALPKGWVIAFSDASRILVSDPKRCVYELDTKQPFVATVLAQ